MKTLKEARAFVQKHANTASGTISAHEVLQILDELNESQAMGSPALDWAVCQDAAVRTEPKAEQYEASLQRLSNHTTLRLLHAGMGLCTEAGEFVDQLKKHIFYGKPLDEINLFEEGGDVSWYLRIAADALKALRTGGQCAFEEMIRTNIVKLKARFPQAFSESRALNRDLDAERATLSSSSPNEPA